MSVLVNSVWEFLKMLLVVVCIWNNFGEFFRILLMFLLMSANKLEILFRDFCVVELCIWVIFSDLFFFSIFCNIWLKCCVFCLKLLVVIIVFLSFFNILLIDCMICFVNKDWCCVIVIWLVGVLLFISVCIMRLYFFCNMGILLFSVWVILCRLIIVWWFFRIILEFLDICF